MLAFLGFWLVAAFVMAFLVLVLGAIMGDFAMVLIVSLPLALCFSLMNRVSRLEQTLQERETAERAVKLAAEAVAKKQMEEEERKEQARIEQEMLEAVVAAELGLTKEG